MGSYSRSPCIHLATPIKERSFTPKLKAAEIIFNHSARTHYHSYHDGYKISFTYREEIKSAIAAKDNASSDLWFTYQDSQQQKVFESCVSHLNERKQLNSQKHRLQLVKCDFKLSHALSNRAHGNRAFLGSH